MAKDTAETSVTELGRGLPAWTLRLVLLLAGLGAVLLQRANGLELLFLLLLMLLAVLVALAPATPAPAMLIVAVAAFAALSGPDPLRPGVLLAIPLLHLVHLSAGLSALVPVTARVHPRALRRPALRFVAVQVVTFAVAGLLAVLPTSRNDQLVEVVALAGTAVLALLAVRLLRGSGGDPPGP